ncbi:GDP-fucose transporter 1 [Lentinula edodes]|uniref:GDP-fucose transporter 1 n=1 Tax=Lentinula edodes TaxID=5353 RepID=A0A1Q3EQY1_LENED|nr:GDP-fucose transporter 1 [Lentinula edodes]
MSSQNAQKPPSRGLVTGVVVFYLVAALSMVMANKWVLNTTEAPLFFLFTQLVIAVVLFVISDTLKMLPDKLTFDVNVCKGLVAMVSLNVIGLSFSNYTLKYVDASFYQVARGLVLPFTVGTSFIMLNARPSLRILFSCGIVTMGFFIGVFLDGTPLSLVGIFFGVVSSAITAIHSVVIKQSLSVVNGSALLLSWYTNLLSALVLIPVIILAGETAEIMKLFFGADELLRNSEQMSALTTFIWGSIITGALGFMMSIASLLSIKVTSPITHMISSAVRGVAASVLGMWLFHDIITSGRASSIAVILLGSIYYTWVKHIESQSLASPTVAYERVKMEDVESGPQRNSHSKPE